MDLLTKYFIFDFRIIVNHQFFMQKIPVSFINDSPPYFVLSKILPVYMMELMISFFQMVGKWQLVFTKDNSF